MVLGLYILWNDLMHKNGTKDFIPLRGVGKFRYLAHLEQ